MYSSNQPGIVHSGHHMGMVAEHHSARGVATAVTALTLALDDGQNGLDEAA
jgi:hypothetical protein